MDANEENSSYLQEKRWGKRLRRKRRAESRKERRSEHIQAVDKRFGRRSKIIDLLAEMWRMEVKIRDSRIQLTIPESFSIISNPKLVLQTIGSFSRAIRTSKIKSVSFDHRKLLSYDLAAESLLDLVADELRFESRYRKNKTRFSGYYPADKHAKRFLKAIGIIKHLDIPGESVDKSEATQLKTFSKRKKHYSRPPKPEEADYKTLVIGQFVDHIDECLSSHGKKLTKLAIQKLGEYVGEILSNAEEHSGMMDWTIQGYLDNHVADPMCEVAIFNFGSTISETLSRLPKESYTATQIRPYVALHKKNGLFSQSWREDDLLTLIALQGHVSSKNSSDTDHRGQGTVDLIEFFQKVHKECAAAGSKAEMAIVSGSTHIRFDGTYGMGEDAQGRKRIAFNQENDLHQKPDSKYVQSLGELFFPGTAISIRFSLSQNSITTL